MNIWEAAYIESPQNDYGRYSGLTSSAAKECCTINGICKKGGMELWGLKVKLGINNWSGRIKSFCPIHQCFSHFNECSNYLGIVLKCRF